LQGARAVQQVILQNYPKTNISVSMIWINMLPSDNQSAMKKATQSSADARVRHFYDPRRQAGKIIAQSLGEPSQVAWDIYLFYSAGSQWGDVPPQPTAWAHQLSGSWVNHHHYGDDLARELHQIAERLTDT
jgi:hypothetical protein